VECAIEVIAEVGVAQASLARIAQRAGVAKSVVLYHFANKDELAEQVLAAISLASYETLPGRLAAATTARDKLLAILESLVDFIGSNRTYALAALETGNQALSLPARARMDDAGIADIRQLFVEGQENGEFGEFDPHVMSVMFRQALMAAVLEAAVNPNADLRAFAAELVGMFDRATRRDNHDARHDHRGGVAG
jgi:TetR/AcrR family transcriptional regulator, fatty acid metabolism regulator protein